MPVTARPRSESSAVLLDPRARVLLLVLGCVPAACFNHPAWTAPAALAVLAVGLAAGAGPALRKSAPFLLTLLTVSTVLWSLLLGQGDPLFEAGPLVFRKESLLFGLAVGLRLVSWSAAGLAFMAVTPVEEMTWALHRLGLPYPAAFGLSMSVRLAGQFTDTARTVSQAQEVRGLDLRSGGLLARTRKAAPMIVPLLVLALRRVNRMAMAMESRGYGAGRRTSWIEHRWGGRETAAVLAAALLAAACVALRLEGFGVAVPGRL